MSSTTHRTTYMNNFEVKIFSKIQITGLHNICREVVGIRIQATLWFELFLKPEQSIGTFNENFPGQKINQV